MEVDRVAICTAIDELVAMPIEGDGLDACADRVILHAYLGAGDAGLAGVVERLADRRTGHGLFGGAARVGWTLAHLADGADAQRACAAIDRTLLAALAGWTGDYDLLTGLVGIGMYALERGAAGLPIARRVIELLGQRAQPRAGGLAWFTPPELLPEDARERAPGGTWSLGVAHGNPAVIGFLARCADVAGSRALLDAAVAHLLAAAPPRAHGRFPPWVDQPIAPRLAWCYGDLGIAAVLLGAALHVGHAGWGAEALALARDCAGRSRETAAITEPSICHGAAGIAHLFHRMARATGDAELAAAAQRWIGVTLELVAAGLTRTTGTILTGAPGVALVLHAAIAEDEPSWDRLLLVDMP